MFEQVVELLKGFGISFDTLDVLKHVGDICQIFNYYDLLSIFGCIA